MNAEESYRSDDTYSNIIMEQNSTLVDNWLNNNISLAVPADSAKYAIYSEMHNF